MSRIVFKGQILEKVEPPDADVVWYRAEGIQSEPDWEDKELGLHDKYAGCCAFMRIVYSYFLKDHAGLGHKEAHSAYCWDCGKAIKQFIPHKLKAENLKDFVFPFGKHKGKKMAEIPVDYLTWCASNLDEGNVKKRVAAYLDSVSP